ncbi:MAG TPA: UDP-N-acetylmuramoyl-L-alanine--D-glutamate ligase [Patescibacteria group bacterium]|nr:UDP-N-acetylmuramoyl-L-alanine--D-glutamate ligase [Patescibacteria group bacterium]
MKKINTRFQNKKVIFLGLGLENFSLLKFLLVRQVRAAEIVVADSSAYENLTARWQELKELAQKKGFSNLRLRNEEDYDRDLEDFDLVLRSPGYPLFSPAIKKAQRKQVDISSPMKLFFEFCPTRNIIGVTGTKGKGTTSSLIYHILEQAGKRVFLGGNIGVAPFGFFSELTRNSWVVLELSSFQLEDMQVSPKIGVITNLYKEHLRAVDPKNPNYHKKLKDYWEAKLNIIRHQKPGDKAVVNERFRLFVISYKTVSRLIFFSPSGLETKLFGEHNRENIGAAEEVARAVNIKKDIVEKAVKSFKGLEHRLEFVKEDKNRVKYFNDSFATTPDATMTALDSFEGPVVLLAGGADKGSDFKKLAQKIKKKCRAVILFSGEATPRLKQELLNCKFPSSAIKQVSGMKQAVQAAGQKSEFGDIVLLSTACASFGLFDNYKQRGELFKSEVKRIK